MEPATRGRGRNRRRGRGRGRGAAAATQNPAESPAEPITQPAQSAFVAPTAPMVVESTESAQSESESQPLERAMSTVPEPVPAEPSPLPDATASAPFQRLDSLKTPTPASSPVASGSSPARGTTRGRKLKVQPKFTGRRSKEERDALEAQAAARERERLAEERATAAAAARGDFRGRGRGRGRGDRGGRGGHGRGGYMGDASSMVFDGPFSAGVVNPQSRNYIAMGRASGRHGFAVPQRTGSSNIKKEPRIKGEKDADINMVLGIKQEAEDGGYISSDPDENIAGPRKDVDFINLLSDEEDVDEGLAPIRVMRREHVDRVVGVNTEKSADTTGSKLRDVGGTNDAIADTAKAAAARKARPKDMEIVKTERKWKGVWENEEDAQDSVRIKDEPIEDSAMPPLPEAPAAAEVLEEDATEEPVMKTASSPERSKKALAKKPRRRRSCGWRDKKPVLQTEEEIQEFHRYQQDLATLVDELGIVQVNDTHIQDAEGDTAMQDAETQQKGNETQLKDKKEDRVYLFQLPPIVPDLLLAPTSVKKETSSPTLTRDTLKPDPSAGTAQTAIKVEDDDSASSTTPGPSLASGLAGKLRVHRSGRATLSWGGTSLELNMGLRTQFLQDAVLARIIPQAERISANDGGEVMAFGQIKGKFVVTPDWEEIVG